MPAVFAGDLRAGSCAIRHQIRSVRALVSAFLVFDVAIKLLRLPMVAESAHELGYQPETMFGLGLVLLTFLIIHWIPRTAVHGAVLLTGYLGGAIATHVRIGNPLFSHQLFPIYVAAFIWGGLYLRDVRARALLGPR
jgi:hypothetical protein